MKIKHVIYQQLWLSKNIQFIIKKVSWTIHLCFKLSKLYELCNLRFSRIDLAELFLTLYKANIWSQIFSFLRASHFFHILNPADIAVGKCIYVIKSWFIYRKGELFFEIEEREKYITRFCWIHFLVIVKGSRKWEMKNWVGCDETFSFLLIYLTSQEIERKITRRGKIVMGFANINSILFDSSNKLIK